MTLNTRHDPRITPRALSVSREAALAGGQARTGVSRPGILPAVERSLASSAVAVPCGHSPRKRGALSLWSSPRHRVFRSLRLDGPSGPRLAARVPWPLPTPRPVAPSELASGSRSVMSPCRFLLQGTCTPFATRPGWAHTMAWTGHRRRRRRRPVLGPEGSLR